MFFVVCYDIPDDRRRLKVFHTLEGYGKNVQKSVFECSLDAKRFKEMEKRLRKLLDPSEDSLRVYQLCQECLGKVRLVGGTGLERDVEVYIV